MACLVILLVILMSGAEVQIRGSKTTVAKASLFNTVLPIADTNLLTTDISPTYSPTYFRIYVSFDKAGIFRVARTISGITITENLNDGFFLKADSSYLWTIESRNGDSINFRYSVTDGTAKILRIDEIGASE